MMIRLPGHFPFKIPRQISGYRFSAGHVFLVMAAFFAGMMLVTPVSAVSLAFSGTVYEGYTPDTSHPLNGVRVQVYGSNNFIGYPPAAKPMGYRCTVRIISIVIHLLQNPWGQGGQILPGIFG